MINAKLLNGSFSSAPSFFDKFLEREWMDQNQQNYSQTNTTLPAINVWENDDKYGIEVAVPGMKKEDFRIEFDNDSVSISSDIKTDHKNNGSILRQEFSYQSFQRSFKIADKVIDADKIEAGYKDGILRISLPKREELKPKPAQTIRIQ